jgi:3-methyladenine DNA glycosylase AlkC
MRVDPERLHGFVALVPSEFVAAYGLDDPDRAIPALEHFTQRCSAEFAVRPFIIRYPQRMMAQMLVWADHPSAEVHRLASEGCRPRLPWGVALPAFKKDPSPILPVLEKLKNDASESVRKSVANNLNDIAKDNPAVTLGVVRRWRQADDSPEMRWVAQHAPAR